MNQTPNEDLIDEQLEELTFLRDLVKAHKHFAANMEVPAMIQEYERRFGEATGDGEFTKVFEKIQSFLGKFNELTEEEGLALDFSQFALNATENLPAMVIMPYNVNAYHATKHFKRGQQAERDAAKNLKEDK